MQICCWAQVHLEIRIVFGLYDVVASKTLLLVQSARAS